MKKIIMAINVTPEGFCDHRAVIADDDLHQFYSDLIKDADTMLYGRKTFQLMDPYWPDVAKNGTGTRAEVEFAQRLDGMQKIVFSRAGIQTAWKNTTVVRELDPAEIQKLKQQPGKDILVGSASIIDQLTQLGLIDSYYFLVQPLISGTGKRFFETIKLTTPVNLQLKDTKLLKSGVIALYYDKAS